MTRTIEHDRRIRESSDPADQPTQGVGKAPGGAQRTERRISRLVYAVPPRDAWYENLPVWVSISIFLHGLILLLMIVLLSSPGTFGIADEGEVERVRVEAGATEARVGSLEQQVAALRGVAAAAPATGTGTGTGDLAPRLLTLEGRVAALCAAASPPC